MHYEKHEPPSSLRRRASRICGLDVDDGDEDVESEVGWLSDEYIAQRILRTELEIDQFTVPVEAVVFIIILSFLQDAVPPASARIQKKLFQGSTAPGDSASTHFCQQDFGISTLQEQDGGYPGQAGHRWDIDKHRSRHPSRQEEVGASTSTQASDHKASKQASHPSRRHARHSQPRVTCFLLLLLTTHHHHHHRRRLSQNNPPCATASQQASTNELPGLDQTGSLGRPLHACQHTKQRPLSAQRLDARTAAAPTGDSRTLSLCVSSAAACPPGRF